MSFAGSCILTGIGGLLYKFDHHQKYVKLPESDVMLTQLNSKVYRKKLNHLKLRIPRTSINFFKDFFDGTSYAYPFKGVVELFKNFGHYRVPFAGIFIVYLFMYSLVSLAYWATITPMYTAAMLFLGPLGLVIAILHTFLHTNALTMMFMRVSHLQNPLVKKIAFVTNYQEFSKTNPIKYYVPITSSYFWLFYLPKQTLKYIFGFFIFLGLMGLCAIPIVGPFAYSLVISPFISKVYISKLLRLKGLSEKQRYDRFLDHLGKYTIFGIFAGLLETIPGISGIALSTNTVAATLWGMNEF